MVSTNAAPIDVNDAAPRRSVLRTLTLVLIVVGLLVSGYLSYVKLTNEPMACIQGSVFNCETVQAHPIGRIAGVPIAVLGFLVYLTLGALTLFSDRHPFLRQNGMLLFFGLLLFAWMYSMYLVYAQFVIIKALCMWCLTHELNITILFIVGILRLRRYFSGDPNA